MKKNGEYVGVDEKFIPEEEKYVDESLLGNKEKTKKTLKTIGKGYLIYVGIIVLLSIIMLVFVLSNLAKQMSFADKITNDVLNTQKDIINGTTNYTQNTSGDLLDNIDPDKISGVLSGAMDSMSGQMNEINIQQFNAVLEMYSGKQSKLKTESLINKVISVNNKEERTITIKFDGEDMQTTNDIKTIYSDLTENEYVISFEYDESGYINRAIIDSL